MTNIKELSKNFLIFILSALIPFTQYKEKFLVLSASKSIDLLADSTNNFSLYCVKGIRADKIKIKKFLDNSLMLVTALAPHIGYDNAAKIAKSALKKGTTLKEEALKTNLISKKDFERIVDPKKMIYPK